MKPGVKTSAALANLGFSHGFFTRKGGASQGPFESLNFTLHSGDAPEAVAENLRRAAGHLDVSPQRLYFLSQDHGTAHQVLSGDEDRVNVLHRTGDITVSATVGVACGVRSADCLTVLLVDDVTGAVAAVHSGWRGTTRNVAGVGVARLRETIGSSGELWAAIGPHIEPCCFEVGEDVATELCEASSLGERAVVRRTPGKAYVDLRTIVRSQLVAAGVASRCIDDVRGCTVCDADTYFSYRRDGKVGGRLLSAIAVRAKRPER